MGQGGLHKVTCLQLNVRFNDTHTHAVQFRAAQYSLLTFFTNCNILSVIFESQLSL